MVSYDMYSVINKGEIAMTTTRMLDCKRFAFFFHIFVKHYYSAHSQL